MNEYPKKRYGKWAGNNAGYAYKPDRCAEEVRRGWLFGQCSRKNGHGDRGLFCKQHAKHHPAQEQDDDNY